MSTSQNQGWGQPSRGWGDMDGWGQPQAQFEDDENGEGGHDIWGMESSAAPTNAADQNAPIRVANKDDQDRYNDEAIREYNERPRNRGHYPKNVAKNSFKKHKHIPWYNRGTPRGYTRSAAIEIAKDPNEFDMSKLAITELEFAQSFSILKDPSLYGQEDLKNMCALITKFPLEDEENIWSLLNMNCGDVQVVYQYFEGKYR